MFYFWAFCLPELALAARVRQETTLPIRWIAARLQTGSPKSLRPMLYDGIHPNEQPATQAVPRKATCIWMSRLTMHSASGGTRIFSANTGTWLAPTNPKP